MLRRKIGSSDIFLGTERLIKCFNGLGKDCGKWVVAGLWGCLISCKTPPQAYEPYGLKGSSEGPSGTLELVAEHKLCALLSGSEKDRLKNHLSEEIKDIEEKDLCDERKVKLEASGIDYYKESFYIALDNTYNLFQVEFDGEYIPKQGTGRFLGGFFDLLGGSGFEGVSIEKKDGFVALNVEAKYLVSEDERRLGGAVYINSLSRVDARTSLKHFTDTFTELLVDDKKSSKSDRFERENKGYEGMAHLVTELSGGERVVVLFALCEGNYCAKKDKDHQNTGHGRMHIFFKTSEDLKALEECQRDFNRNSLGSLKDKFFERCRFRWDQGIEVNLPRDLEFIDYSGMDIRFTKTDEQDVYAGEMIVSSQESAELAILSMQADLRDLKEKGDIKTSFGGVQRFSFPRANDGSQVYCNVEGVVFLGERGGRLIGAVSDRAKGSQDKNCRTKDQSVHIFRLPRI